MKRNDEGCNPLCPSQHNKPKPPNCTADQVAERTKLQLLEAQKTIANKDVIIKMLQNHVKKMGESFKNNLRKTEEYRFKYCQAMEQVDKNKTLCPKKEKHEQQQSEIRNIKNELQNWKQQCENLLKERSHSSTCRGPCENVEVIMKEHYDLLRNLISKIAVQRTINKSLSRTNSDTFTGCPYKKSEAESSAQQVDKLKDEKVCEKVCPAPSIVEKLLALNEKLDHLNSKEEKNLKELQAIKAQIASVQNQAQICAGGIVKLNDNLKNDKEDTFTKLSSVEILVKKNVGIQEELAEIRKRIEEVLRNLETVRNKPEAVMVVERQESFTPRKESFTPTPEREDSDPEPKKKKIKKGCTDDTCAAKKRSEPDNIKTSQKRSESDSVKMLQDHYNDLSREKMEKDEHIRWLNELINYYKKLNNDLTQLELPKMPPEEFSESDEEIKQYIYKVDEDNTKLKTTISNAMSNLETKISNLNTKVQKPQNDSQTSGINKKDVGRTSRVTINCDDSNCSKGSQQNKGVTCGECEIENACGVCEKDNDSYTSKCDECDSNEETSSKSDFVSSVTAPQTSQATTICPSSCGNCQQVVPTKERSTRPSDKGRSDDSSVDKTSIGSDIDIEDIYKSVLSACQKGCRKRDQCAKVTKPVCEYEDEEENFYRVTCTCAMCICDQRDSNFSSPSSAAMDTTTPNPDPKNLLSNLESYKYYLQQQLEIISNIESEIDGLHDIPKSDY